jgi:hypothetical protein
MSNRECIDISYDDAHCTKLAECCAGINDPGLQRQCLWKVRKCRKMGNAWDAAAPLRPLDTRYLYTDAPGYTTQGQLVLKEGFGFGGLTVDCVVKGMACGLLVALLIKYLLKTDISIERIIGVSILGGLIQCMLKFL